MNKKYLINQAVKLRYDNWSKEDFLWEKRENKTDNKYNDLIKYVKLYVMKIKYLNLKSQKLIPL